MNLKELKNIQSTYDSDNEDILNQFYIPALSSSVKYHRLAGFFSSSSLAVAARGMSQFIVNGGTMKLLTCAQLSQKDIDAIKSANNNPEELIERNFIKEVDEIKSEFIKDHARALGWMIANKRLEIKIVIVVDRDKQPVADEVARSIGIFHQKVGILEDKDGSRISFSGSQNESAMAWINNVEEIKIFKEWIDGDKKFFNGDVNKFNKYWNGNTDRTIVINASEAINKKLVKIAPRAISELKLERYNKITSAHEKKNRGKIRLRPYQTTAIKRWKENNYCGIFEMATGTGKTFTALGCLECIMRKENQLLSIISAPYNHLVKQWQGEMDLIIDDGDNDEFIKLKKLYSNSQLIIGSSNYKWKKELANKLIELQNGIIDHLVVYTTHDTLASQFLIDKISSTTLPSLIIIDEVHGIGTKTRKQGLLDNYKYRLGLSATPRRWMDEEGTDLIFNFFNNPEEKPTYEFSLEEAITKINPLTGKTFLTPYKYIPHFTELDEVETEEYIKYSKQISKVSNYKDNSENSQNYYQRLIEKRANIIKSAKNKLVVLEDILNEIAEESGEIKDTLIYCNPGGQLEDAQDILNARRIKQHKFTSNEDIKPEKKYLGFSERGHILKNFSEGHFEVLVAMKCLDEGVDIPSAKNGVIMASSTNPREFIQRRGRLLRYYPNKIKAYIYDIIVMPPDVDGTNNELSKQNKRLLEKELLRYKEFAQIAANSSDCLVKLIEIAKKYNVYV